MKPATQRIAIAEVYGISRIWEGAEGRLRGHNEADEWILVPDYLNDLNAMHEVEDTLIFSERQKYYSALQRVMSESIFHSGHLISPIECCRATAAQRAEAFLRTIGKWEDEK